MRKLVLLTTAAAALAVAGLAIAHGVDNKSVTAVTATFAAQTVTDRKTETCTGPNGHTYESTKATYTGTAAGPAELTGPITFEAKSLVDTTTGDGVISGKLRIDTAGAPGKTDAHFDGVLHAGTVAGLAEGHTSTPDTKLIANVSGAFTTATGFAAGSKIGGGTAPGYAVDVGPGGCKPAPAPKPDTIKVHGAVSAITPNATAPTSITAANVTCTIPPALQSKVAGLTLAVGDQVELECTSAGGTNTLTKIEAKHKGKHH
jgi:hypothetical protein